MKTKLLAHVFLLAAFSSAYSHASHYSENETYEVASLIINLSKSITRDLSPPRSGAERTVTKAVVSEDNNSRIYYIEGKDIYHTGRVVSTYWIRLTKPLYGPMMTAQVEIMNGEPVWGRDLPEETTKLLGPLLNSLYDIAELDLAHRNVVIEEIADHDADTIHIVGLNQVCDHDDLNRFRLSMMRRVEGSRTWYETNIEHPFTPLPPTMPLVPIRPVDPPAPVETCSAH